MSTGSERAQEVSEGKHHEDESQERRTNLDHFRMVDGAFGTMDGALKATPSS